MTWLETLAVATAPAAVTAAALLYQQYRQDIREAARAAQEREAHDRERADSQERGRVARKQQLDDVWRDERLRAHTNALTALTEWFDSLGEVLARASQENGDEPPHPGLLEEDDAWDERTLLSRITFVGTAPSIEKLTLAYVELRSITFLIANGAKHSDIRRQAERVRDATFDYEEAARAEIGITF